MTAYVHIVHLKGADNVILGVELATMRGRFQTALESRGIDLEALWNALDHEGGSRRTYV